VKLVEKGSHFVEPVIIEKFEDGYREKNLRRISPGWKEVLMRKFPRFSAFLAKNIIPEAAVKDYPALQISRGFLPSVGERITGTIMTTPRSHGISIPFGNVVNATFLVPHAFANLNHYDGFLEEFIRLIENPQTIPPSLTSAKYEEDK